MRRVLGVGALSLLVASCGAAGPVIDARPASETVVDTAGDLRLTVVERPTEGRVWLSLFLDAGSRDGSRPSVAITSALVATAAHPSVSARTLPDGTELSTTCRASSIERCLAELAGVLSTRTVDDLTLARAHERWEASRALALSDPVRRAPSLAVEALLGRDVDPYAGQPATLEEVRSFLSAHYGPARALLVAVGDVPRGAVQRAATTAFLRNPRADLSREPRRVERRRDVRVELALGGPGQVAVATWRPTLEEARALAERWLARGRAFGVERASADVFPIRGGAVLLVRGEGDVTTVTRLLARLQELEAEHPEGGPVHSGDDPAALARWIGARWCTALEQPVDDAADAGETSGGIGVGVVAAAGRGDDLDAEDPDRAAMAELDTALRTALDERAGEVLEGSIDANRVDARTARGVILRGARLAGAAEVALAIGFDGGPSEEDPTVQGISAMLATVLGETCAEIARDELGASLAALGFEVRPVLSATRWGLTISGPRERWAELTYLAPRCVSTIRPTATRLANARLGLEGSFPLRAELARSLEPSRPGGLVPEGTTASRAAVEAPELRRWFRTHAVARRARVGLSGDLRVDLALRRVADGLAVLPEGAAFEDEPAPGASLGLRGVHRDDGLRVAIGWSAPGDDALSARGFSEAVRPALEQNDGMRGLFSGGSAFGGRVYAWVGLTASPETLDALLPLVERALATLAWDELARRSTEEREEAFAWTGGTPRSLALSLLEPPARHDEDEVGAQLQGLARAAPVVVVARPQPGQR